MKHSLFRQSLFFATALILTIVTFLIISLFAVTASATGPGHSLIEDHLSLTDYPPGYSYGPSRTVIQIIDNKFYKWHEYENSKTGALSIYLLKPEEKALSRVETIKLLLSSKQWKNQAVNYTSAPTESSTDQFLPRTASQITLTANEQIAHALENTFYLDGMTDDRTAVGPAEAVTYPYNTIGFLATDFPDEFMRGTGFLISPYSAITNAHNIYSTDFGGWYDIIRFSPAQHEDKDLNVLTPHSTHTPVQAEINSNFKYYEDAGDRDTAVKYDYGAIFFEQPIEGISTFMPIEFNYQPAEVCLIGYPGNVNGTPTLGMWLAEGPVVNIDDYCLFYEAYTSGGSSGSPVFVYNETAGTYRVVAIHSFISMNNLSGGPYFNSNNRNLIEKWVSWTPEPPEEEPEEEKPTKISELSLSSTSLNMIVGNTQLLEVTVSSESIDHNELVWVSNHPNIATVDDSGLVTARGEGRTLVRVMTADGRVETECEVNVFEATFSSLPGDINGDNMIDVRDVVMVTRHVLNYDKLEPNQLQSADVNNDGIVDVRDVALIMQFALGLIAKY